MRAWAAQGGTPQDGSVLLQIDFFPGSPAVLDAAIASRSAHLDLSDAVSAVREEAPVTYLCVLPIPHRAVQFAADLLTAHQRQLGTRRVRRALDAWEQAVAFQRWMLDGVEPDRLAVDAGIGRSTAHRNVNEALTVVAA